MSLHKATACTLALAALALTSACSENDGLSGVNPTPPPPGPVVPTSVEEALAVPDEEFDYAAVFDDSGRGGF